MHNQLARKRCSRQSRFNIRARPLCDFPFRRSFLTPSIENHPAAHRGTRATLLPPGSLRTCEVASTEPSRFAAPRQPPRQMALARRSTLLFAHQAPFGAQGVTLSSRDARFFFSTCYAIKKSSFFAFPPFVAAVIQRGMRPRPVQVFASFDRDT